MKTRSILFSLIVLAITSCSQDADLRYRFENIIDISLTPVERTRHTGTFTDAGSWMGFTLPEEDKWISGFCGPFSINEREWLVQSAVTARYARIPVLLFPFRQHIIPVLWKWNIAPTPEQ